MDRYAHRLHDWLESSDFGFRVNLAAHVGSLTRDSVGRRGSAGEKRSNRRKAFVRWWSQPVDPSRVVLPGPLHGPQSYAARSYIVGTDWLKRELATWLGDERNIHVVPFGVDRAFFGESAVARDRGRREWRIPDDAFVVLHVGSTVDRKNVPLVIQTVARLRQQTDTYLLQVGGRFSAEQEQLIERLD